MVLHIYIVRQCSSEMGTSCAFVYVLKYRVRGIYINRSGYAGFILQQISVSHINGMFCSNFVGVCRKVLYRLYLCQVLFDLIICWQTNKTDSVHINITFEVRSQKRCCHGKAISITYCECVFVALVIQHAMYMHHIVICMACLALHHFSTLSHKQHSIGGGIIERKIVFWLSVQLLSETYLILRRTERNMIKNVYCSPCKIPVILLRS